MARPLPAHAARARRTVGLAIALVAAAAAGLSCALTLTGSGPDAWGTATPTSPTASGIQPGPPDAGSLPAQPPPVRPVPTVAFTLVAGGDVLPHQPVLRDARTAGGYDFSAQFAPTEPIVAGADLAICHMEAPVVPAGGKPSGYPMFGAPAALVAGLGRAGWDGCSTASNHSVDRGFAGITATADAFQAAGLGHAGTARSLDESAQIQYYNVVKDGRTVSVAHISFAYGLNGLPVPAGKPWSVNVFDASAADVTPILKAARRAREQGADVVIASVHCCVEYRTQPTQTQQLIAQRIADSGLVDLYIGHHAHVPQPIVKLPGGPDGTGMWVAYGLGNFISNQDATTVGHAQTVSGVLLRATITVSPDDLVTVDVGWTAVTVDRTSGHVVYPIGRDSGAVGGLTAAQVRSRWNLVHEAVGDAAPEVTGAGTQLADFMWSTTRTP